MDKIKLPYFKELLLKERRKVMDLLEQLERNEVINSNSEMASELSFYDNHPSDTATELYDKEKGLAIKENEISIINKINASIKRIEEGTYGKCRVCNEDIPIERLEFIPYADCCVKCQSASINNVKEKDRAIEEDSLKYPFGYGYNDFKEDIQFDAEDSYQSVARFNRREVLNDDYYEDEEFGYVEPIEKISNEQYKMQLPD